jgi:hypothetical protein
MKEHEEGKLTPEERAELEAEAAETGLPGMTAEEYLKHIHAEFLAGLAASGMTREEYVKHNLRMFFEMLADIDLIEQANEIVELHLTGDDWKLSDDD